METGVLAGSRWVPVPVIEGAYSTLTYVLEDPAQVLRIAEELGVKRGSSADRCALYEHHYAGGSADRWIVAVRWESDGLRFIAQSGPHPAPTLEPVEAVPA
jgi:hypothetical protein